MPKIACGNCQQHVTVDDEYAGLQIACPNCENVMVVPNFASIVEGQTPPQIKTGRVKRVGETMGNGCLVQLVGVGIMIVSLFIFWPLGILGLVFLIVGSAMAYKYVCSECGNKLDNRSVKLCPTCRVQFR